MAKEVTTYNPQDESVVVYQSADHAVQLNVRVSDETVWLTQQQMADLFGTQRQAITKHVKNIYECAELQPFATSSILEQVQKEGRREVTRQIALTAENELVTIRRTSTAEFETAIRRTPSAKLRKRLTNKK